MGKDRIREARIRKLAKEAGKAGLRGIIVVPGPNLTYLTGARSFLMERPFMLLVPASGTPQLVVPAL